MAKFTFPVPGRKKQTPQVTVTAPSMSKAQRILGSTAFNIDAPSNGWDDVSNSGISVSVSESTAATSYGSSTVRGFGKTKMRSAAAPEKEWGDESEIVPRHLRDDLMVGEETDNMTDMSSVVRKRQSSSTLVSWYDKSMQPLSISQQTSASAMAKGLPPKAHKMLDMDNIQSAKVKKKPSKLDLSNILARSRGQKNGQQPWNGPMLEPDYVVKSPSVMSQFSPPAPGQQRQERGTRLQKRSTKESLRSQNTESSRPGTSGSNRRGTNHLNGLPNLYEHYEQMSFRQILGPEYQQEEAEHNDGTEPHSTNVRNAPSSKPTNHTHQPLAKHHDERVISDYATRNLPQTPQAAPSHKTEHTSPSDYATSISSRHTRTSKASKRTEHSFQDSDLLEKSVLSLSSDSEDDIYIDPPMRSPSSLPNRRASDAESANNFRPPTSRTTGSTDSKRLSRSSKGSKRTSFAPTNTYLTIPSGQSNKPSAANPRSGPASGGSVDTIQETSERTSSARESTTSNWSASTTSTWQSQLSYSQETRAIAMLPARAPAEREQDSERASNHLPRDSIAQSADQPTPPLSPSSVDFYIRSAHSSLDGPGSHNRFMAVTRQEEMLLAALRHKRQIMRETVLSEMDEERGERRPSKGHQSVPSEATITEATTTEADLDFDFPAPPTCKDKTTLGANGTKVIDLSRSPPTQSFDRSRSSSRASTRSSSKKGNLKKVHPDIPEEDRHERILLYLDHPSSSSTSSHEPRPKPSLNDFIELQEESDSELPEEVLYARRQQRNRSSQRESSSHRSRTCISRQSDISVSSSNRTIRAINEGVKDGEVGVPRPDSPISPEGLGAPPPPKRSNLNKKMARLSAVGAARWGNED